MDFHYDEKLYNEQSAREVLPYLLEIVGAKSVVDVGCGLGTWLSVASQMGVQEYLGVEATPYDPNCCTIPESKYHQANLSQMQLDLGSFQLCICLEVAEHLPESDSDKLVRLLCQLSPVVLFSAAIPHQPGQHHINCQWPDYWQQKFEAMGYRAFDVLREKFWNNEKVEWWYRQNMLLYARPELLPGLQPVAGKIPALIHPALYQLKTDTLQDLQGIKESTIFYPNLYFALRSLAKALLVTPWKKKNIE